jgi:allophanate hydrolase subunit 2
MELGWGKFEVEVDARIFWVLTGAHWSIRVNGALRPGWKVQSLSPGDRLSVESDGPGAIAYFCVAGVLQSRRLFGSAATAPREALEGMDQGRICAGSTWSVVRSVSTDVVLGRLINPKYIPDYRAPLSLEFFPGEQWSAMPTFDRERFLQADWRLGKDSDRVGFRLDGSALGNFPPMTESEGMLRGSVQVPPDGKPMIMMNDGPSMGGYPKAGCISARSCDALAQRRPGDLMRFVVADLRQCQLQRQSMLRFFACP